ncbi:MAG: pilus retraction protein PilT [Planctomycetota bacterium]
MSGDYNISDEEFSFKELADEPHNAVPAPSHPSRAGNFEAQEGPAGSSPPAGPADLSGATVSASTEFSIPALDLPDFADLEPHAEGQPAPPADAMPSFDGAPLALPIEQLGVSASSDPEQTDYSQDALGESLEEHAMGSVPAEEPAASTPQELQQAELAQPHGEAKLEASDSTPGPAKRPRLRPLRRGSRRNQSEATETPAAAETEVEEESAHTAGQSRRQFKGPSRVEARPVITGGSQSPRHMLQNWLSSMVRAEASDLILRAGGRPSLRVDGRITFLPGRVPGPGPLLEVLEGVMGTARMANWGETGSADAAIHLDGLGRFRLNAYKQMGEPAVVIRRINEDAPNLEHLELPAVQLRELAQRRRGLVLVTGIAGSGKSTTLAGMIQHMNENFERHVITLEDPVELLFKEKRCVISQREVGTDTPSFKDGLRHALRQSPDVIFIGEVRDADTVVAALEATETGHLVMSTMHTVNAAQTLDRILGFFPAERHQQIRQRMGDNLMGVLSQRLVPKRGDNGMLPAYELMMSTPHIRELIEEGKTGEIARVIESGSEAGLISFNECLRGLVENHKIELEDALAASDRPEELLLALRGIRGSADRVQAPTPGAVDAGPDDNHPDGLRMAAGE